jgi:hypothetical protein
MMGYQHGYLLKNEQYTIFLFKIVQNKKALSFFLF